MDKDDRLSSLTAALKQHAGNSIQSIRAYACILRQSFDEFWQYPLFRLLVYIVAVLSFAPTTIFLSYALFVLFIATCTFTTMWILTVSAFITIGCVVLIPILMAATFTAVGVVACCGVWVRLRNFYKAMKAPSADNKAL